MPVMGYAPLAVVPWIGEPGAAGRSRAIRVVGWFQERRAAIGRRSGSSPMCSWRELATEAPELAGASVASSRQLHIGLLPERRPIAARRSWNQPTTRIARERPAAPGSPIHGTTASGA